jgi:hypothetical protein
MKDRISKIFYVLPDRFVRHTDARLRRAINFWLLIVWIFPGIFIWFIFKDALWFVGFMSIYALWSTHFGAFSAETPVEQEEVDKEN